jgi:hypothetical protein
LAGRLGGTGGDGAFDGFVPIVLAGFPAEGDAGAAIFVAGFEHEIRTIFAHEIEQLDVFAVMRGAGILDYTRPGDVVANDLAFAVRKQSAVAFVCEYGEKRFHVGNLAAEGVSDADGIGGVSSYEGFALFGTRDDIVNEYASVDEIDVSPVGGERLSVEDEVARVGEHNGHAHFVQSAP